MKTAVIFFSLTGNTRRIAEIAARELNAQILEIKLKRELPKSMFLRIFLGGMQSVFKMKPRLKDYSIKMGDYSHLVIGTPVWAGNFASAIRTFLAKENISGKKIALLATCGSDPGQTIPGLKEALAGNEIIAEAVFTQAQLNQDDWNEQALAFAGNIRLKMDG